MKNLQRERFNHQQQAFKTRRLSENSTFRSGQGARQEKTAGVRRYVEDFLEPSNAGLNENGILGQPPSGQEVGILSLGCARNLVDSQEILGRLRKHGREIVDISQAQVAVVNTCAFIADARQESIDAILNLIDLKRQGKIKKIIVTGCLAERYGRELLAEFKEIDALIGVPAFSQDRVPDQMYLTPQHFAYVKICESCYNQCRFCVIPQIKGKFSSRRVEAVLSEVKMLDEKGVKEIAIIGQDITAYGMDLYGKKSLAGLLKEIIKTTRHIQWIRLLYTFPAHITDELIDVIAGEERICKYIDIPLQHISDPLLKSMHRRITAQQTRDLIQKIRTRIPQASLRTAFIAGMPGETEEHFEELLAFVKEMRFEKVGVFTYSREEGTPAYHMPHHVPERIKQKRYQTLMEEQQKISGEILQQSVGKRLKVLIEEEAKEEKDIYTGRTEYDAPEVDGLIYVRSQNTLHPGDFVSVTVTDSSEYDRHGEVI